MMSESDSLRAELARFAKKLEAFRKVVDGRFDEVIELLTSNVRAIRGQIRSLKQS
jgi:hypothetical protein